MTEKLRLLSRLGVCISLCLVARSTYGQATILKSPVDESLAIKTVTIAPILDNVSQIYGKPLTVQLKNIVENDRQWDLRSFPESIKNTPEEFEDHPDLVKAAVKKAGTDALFTARLTKGPSGISIKLNLFLGADGLLLAQESLHDYDGFEIADLRTQMESLYAKIKSRLPYAGIVLSRKNQQVTVNLGANHGLKEGHQLSVVQIIKLNRHPRFHFVVSAEKEIIGRIQIDKAEESLSFGTIQMERTENVIQPGMKLMPINFVTYPTTMTAADGKMMPELSSRPDAPVMLGPQPREWTPAPAPSLGKVGLMLGLGNYAVNNTLNTAGAINSSQLPTPSIHLDGELWLTTHWFMNWGLSQYVLSLDNSYPGSSPGKISASSTKTTLQAGYNFLLQDDFFGPKFQLLAGYSKFSTSLDTSSPEAFTSMSFSGLALGIGGSLPVSEEMPLSVGAKLLYHLSPSVAESPVTSGSSSSASITSFSAFGIYRSTEHINFRGELMYDLYSASFSGTGTRTESASSASHSLTTFAGGIEYLF